MMKTKTLLKLAAWMSIPLIVSLLTMTSLTVMIWCGKQEMLMKFCKDELNTDFIGITSIIGVLSISFLITALLSVLRHANNIDRLDQAIGAYLKEKEKFKQAAEALAERIKIE